MSETLDFKKDSVHWPHQEFSQIIETPKVQWHVQIAGHGPPLLLLHGTGSSTHTWAGLLPFLSEGYTVIAPDLPGQGFTKTTDTKNFSILGMAHVLTDLLEKIKVAPEFCIGHSAGAAVLARMVLDRRIEPRCLISLNGAFFPFGGALTHFFSPLAKILALNPAVSYLFTWSANDRASVSRLLQSTGSSVPQSSVDIYQRLFRCPSHVSSTLAMMASWDLETLIKDIPQLNLPVLLIVGENDQTINPKDGYKLRDLLPSCTLVSLPQLGHLAHEENPSQVAETILTFINTKVS